MTPLSPAERQAALDDAGAILDRTCDALGVPRFDGDARAPAVDELAHRLVLDRDASYGPLTFEGAFVADRFEFRPRSTAAIALAGLDDRRVARALDAVRAWSATEGRAVVPDGIDSDRVHPLGSGMPDDYRAKRDAMRAHEREEARSHDAATLITIVRGMTPDERAELQAALTCGGR